MRLRAAAVFCEILRIFSAANSKRLADAPRVAREELTSVIAVSREPSAAVASAAVVMAAASTCEWVALTTVTLVTVAVGLAPPISVAVLPRAMRLPLKPTAEMVPTLKPVALDTTMSDPSPPSHRG